MIASTVNVTLAHLTSNGGMDHSTVRHPRIGAPNAAACVVVEPWGRFGTAGKERLVGKGVGGYRVFDFKTVMEYGGNSRVKLALRLATFSERGKTF